jgi:HEAT repeat protein
VKKTLAFLSVLFLFSGLTFSQGPTADTKERIRGVRELAKQGTDAVPKLAPYVGDADLDVRIEAVKAISEIGGPASLDPLVKATADPDPEIQIRATDGLVNFYLPGYLKTGITGSIRRAGNSIRAKFTDTNDQVIDTFVEVRPEVITSLGRLARGGASLEVRANAARAVGILRGRAAIPDLTEALHSKDDQVMFEALIAIQKIRDPEAGPRIAFLLRDLNEKIQMTALETAGLLRDKSSSPQVRDAFEHARTPKVKKAALSAMAMLEDPADHATFVTYLTDKDESLRAAAAEGLGRLKNPADRGVVDKVFVDEKKMNPRLSQAFALVELGNLNLEEFAPLRYLINTLNVRSYKGVSLAFLVELAREAEVRKAIYTTLPRASKDEKINLGIVLARSGDRESLPYVQNLSTDVDNEVAQEGIRSLRTLRARLQ